MGSRGSVGLAAVALAGQVAVLYAPRAPAPPVPGLPWDKAIHVIAFALPTWALVRAGLPLRWTVALMAAHGPVSELIQHAVLPDRSGEPADVVADLVGVGLGALVSLRTDPPGPRGQELG